MTLKFFLTHFVGFMIFSMFMGGVLTSVDGGEFNAEFLDQYWFELATMYTLPFITAFIGKQISGVLK